MDNTVKRIGIRLLRVAVDHGFERVKRPSRITLEDIEKRMENPMPDFEHDSEVRSDVPRVSVSNEETVRHQRKEIIKETLLLEAHLLQKCKIEGKPCDCCEKHPLALEGLALETLGMTGDSVYGELADFSKKIAPMTTKEASGSGKHDEEYPMLAKELRVLRKKVMNA